MTRSPFVAILPDGVPMAFAVDTPLSDVITVAKHAARSEGGDVQIVREENLPWLPSGMRKQGVSRFLIGTVRQDGSWEEA